MDLLAGKIARLEERIQRDEGNRGIRAIIPGSGILYSAASAILNQSSFNSVAILTGFPCLMDFDPPIETDGPPGALILAHQLESIGKSVSILSDNCAESSLRSLINWYNSTYSTSINLLTYSPTSDLSSSPSFDTVICIERPGASKDSHYYTMRGFDMSHLVAPLDTHYCITSRPRVVIGIGDGGNEAGMGNMHDKISQHITNGPKIASTTKSDYPIVCSVSNWGGYALSLSLAILHSSAPILSNSIDSSIFSAMNTAGIRDGITKELSGTVDGMAISVNSSLIQDLLGIYNN